MDKFWITPLEGNKIYEVEISGWVLSPRKQLQRALIQVQREGKTIISVHRFQSFWNYHYLVFTSSL